MHSLSSDKDPNHQLGFDPSVGEVAPIVLSTVSFFLFHYRQGLEELALNRFQGSLLGNVPLNRASENSCTVEVTSDDARSSFQSLI